MTNPAPAVTQVTLVTAPDCHFCHDAREVLTTLSVEGRIGIEVIEGSSEAGRALVATHRPPMMPLVLIDGGYFSAGRLPRRKLNARLATSSAVAVH